MGPRECNCGCTSKGVADDGDLIANGGRRRLHVGNARSYDKWSNALGCAPSRLYFDGSACRPRRHSCLNLRGCRNANVAGGHSCKCDCARPSQAGLRPLKNVELLEVLDDRDLAKGLLTLEFKASGHGLLPELNELIDLAVPGFKVAKSEDKGLSIAKMDAESDEVAPISERNWVISLSRDGSENLPVLFQFPKARLEGIAMSFKRYVDADLAEVKPEVALAGVTLAPRSPWRWLAPVLVLVLGAIGFIWWRTRLKTKPAQEIAAYVVPSQITPFSVLSLLRRMHADQKLPLKVEQRQELGEAISALQQYFFDRPPVQHNGQPDLEQIARRWVSCSGT